MFNIILVSISVTASVAVLNFHFRGHRRNRVPKLIRKLFFIKAKQKALPIDSKPIQNDIDYSLNSFNEKNQKYFIYMSQNGNGKINTNRSGGSKHRFSSQLSDKTIDIIKDERYTFNQMVNSSSIPICLQNKTNNHDTDNSSGKKKSLEKLLLLIKKSLRILEANHHKSKENSIIYDEWKELAFRVDHILFIISAFIVMCAPIFLFGKFYFKDVYSTVDRSECGCGFK
jgi:hypothetical protein